MHPSSSGENARSKRQTRPLLAIAALLAVFVPGIATVGPAASDSESCQFCPYAVNETASPGLISSVNYPTTAECLGTDSGTILDNGYAWLSLSETGTLALTGRIKGAWHVDGGTSVCFKKSSGTLELWNGNTLILSKGGTSATALQIDDRCYLEILAGSTSLWRSGSGGCVPSTATKKKLIARDHPEPAECLTAGTAGTIIDNGKIWLNFESNGDLVAYTSKGRVWHTDTSGSDYQLCFQDDEYFHVVDKKGNKKWHADGTGDGKGETLLFTGDCHVAINNGSGSQIWKSGSGGCP